MFCFYKNLYNYAQALKYWNIGSVAGMLTHSSAVWLLCLIILWNVLGLIFLSRWVFQLSWPFTLCFYLLSTKSFSIMQRRLQKSHDQWHWALLSAACSNIPLQSICLYQWPLQLHLNKYRFNCFALIPLVSTLRRSICNQLSCLYPCRTKKYSNHLSLLWLTVSGSHWG